MPRRCFAGALVEGELDGACGDGGAPGALACGTYGGDAEPVAGAGNEGADGATALGGGGAKFPISVGYVWIGSVLENVGFRAGEARPGEIHFGGSIASGGFY